MDSDFPKSVSNASSPAEASIEAVVIRCGCGDPDAHNGVRGAPSPCPRPRATEDLGVVSYYSPNPLKRLYYRFFKKPFGS
jgi:hypothetical protein